MAAREGGFMRTWFGAAAVLLAACPAFAADVATCTLSADKKSVTVTASNPYSKVMACEVNCDMAIAGGFATVSCAKPVPVGSKDFVMCTDVADEGHPYVKVKGTKVNCPDPSGPPATANGEPAKAEPAKDDGDDDDAKADELMKKMLKQGQELLDRQKQK
jgi:hypothetical protein